MKLLKYNILFINVEKILKYILYYIYNIIMRVPIYILKTNTFRLYKRDKGASHS